MRCTVGWWVTWGLHISPDTPWEAPASLSSRMEEAKAQQAVHMQLRGEKKKL